MTFLELYLYFKEGYRVILVKVKGVVSVFEGVIVERGVVRFFERGGVDFFLKGFDF